MSRTLVILESGTKTTYFKKYLDSDRFIIEACFGHIRDLHSKQMSVDIENTFKPKYYTIAGKQKIISNLKQKLKLCDSVFLACDNDREGESISWHLSEVLKIKSRKRIIFNEITKKSIQSAVKNPVDLDMNKVNAQQARRIIDRIIGFTISPLLWKNIQNSYEKKKTLSAGRVQSVVLKLIIEREEEISKFQPDKKFKIDAVFRKKNSFDATLNREIRSYSECRHIIENCSDTEFTVDDIKTSESVKKPPLPFVTSSLQQEASNKFSMSPRTTMSTAQKLYERGLITYHRTDSVILSDEAKENIKNYIKTNFGDNYFKDRVFINKSGNCQEAHEAIRPSNINNNKIEDCDEYEKKLYNLIHDRTISCLMSECHSEIKSYIIKADKIKDYNFISKTEKILFEGFTRVLKSNTKQQVIELNKGDIVDHEKVSGLEKYTKPPKQRYTEASLIKKLEELGLGRPSTYASMACIVQDRGYVSKKNIEGVETELLHIVLTTKIEEQKVTKILCAEKNKLVPEDIGIIVNRFMTKHFDFMIDYRYTSFIEEKLDRISEGTLHWLDFIKNVYSDICKTKSVIENIKTREKDTYRRVLGKYPGTDKDIICYIGQYGPVVSYTPDSGKKKYSSLYNIKIDDITAKQAVELLTYPVNLGTLDNKNIYIKNGKNGPYINYDSKNYSFEQNEKITKKKASEIIKQACNTVIKKIDSNITLKNGKYGPYIYYVNKKKTYFINLKKHDPHKITKKECLLLIKQKLGD